MSKLLPAQTYLTRLLGEICSLLEFNLRLRQEEFGRITHELAIIMPCFDALMAHNGIIHADLRRFTEDVCLQIGREAKDILSSFEPSRVICRVPWSGLLNLYKFNQIVNESVLRESFKAQDSARARALSLTKEASRTLFQLAASHAKSIFREDIEPDEANLLTMSFAEAQFSPSLPATLNFWQIFELSLLKTSTWMGAATLAGAALGYQPLFSLALRVFEFSRYGGRLFTTAVIVGASLLAILALVDDVESLVKQRLQKHYSSYFSSPLWIHEPAGKLEGIARKVLASRETSLVNEFDTALHQQRQIQAAKDLQRAQVSTALQYLDERLQNSRVLLKTIQGFRL